VTISIEELPLSKTARRELQTFAARPEHPVLTVLEGYGDLAQIAGIALAENMVRFDARVSDVHIARPSADRWTIEELEELVIRPAYLTPVDRTVIVLDAADRMDTGCAEHLLKTVEEPPARCSFIFVVQDVQNLLVTLRSRTQSVLRAVAPSSNEQISALLKTECSRETAITAQRRMGNLTLLAEKACLDQAVMQLTDVFDTRIYDAAPFSTSTEIANKLEELAKLGDPFSARSRDTDKAQKDTVVRARTRTLARHLLSTWQAQVSEALAKPSITVAELALARAVAAAIDEAYEALERYVSVRNVLMYVLTACSTNAVQQPG
jgi:DNA polymerase III delta prime subunit